MDITTKQLYLIFHLDDRRYALPLPMIQCVIAAVAVTPLAQAPEIIKGIINYHGQIIPVVDIRPRLALPAKTLEPTHHFIIFQISKYPMAMVVDAVEEIKELDEHSLVHSQSIIPDSGWVTGIIKYDDDLLLIHDYESFFNLEVNPGFNHAMKQESK